MTAVRPAPAAAAGWGVIFAMVHAYWALGGPLGLPAGLDLRSIPALFIVDVVAIPLCLLAAAAALAADSKLGRPRLALWGWLGCLAVAVLCLVHSVPPLAGLLSDVAAGRDLPQTSRERHALYLYEPWWFLGGVLFSLAAIRTRPRLVRP